MTTKAYTIPELWECLESRDTIGCNIFPYGYYDGETSEDPIQTIDGLDNIINWIIDNPSYPEWGEDIGYLIVTMNSNGEYAGDVVF